MAIDPIKKSTRLLQSRRYTRENLQDSQEAFTRVLDLNASEIYSQENLIPSATLPFSESGQNGYYYTAEGTISPTATGEDVLKYWHRHRLSPGLGTNETWFFLNEYTASSPASPNIQQIQAGQEVNFISPKYAIPLIAGNNAEAGGYNIRLFINGAEYTEAKNYAFDYKTGVLQWTSSAVAPSANANISVTTYQYVGKTLADNQTSGYSGSFSGSFQGDGSNLTNVPASGIVGLNLSRIASDAVTGSISTGSDSFTLTSASVDLFKVSNTGIISGSGASLRDIPASAIIGLNLDQIASGDITASVGGADSIFKVVSGSTVPLIISSSGQIRTSQSLVQPVTQGVSLSSIDFSPVFTNSTSSQTQIAVKINPTFTGSYSGSETSNIIADFGSVGTGTQLRVTDVTTGSIYTVNDYSGLPILEATSDTGFKIYSFPHTVLYKSESILTLGSSTYSGSRVQVSSQFTIDQGFGHTYSTVQTSGSTTAIGYTASLYSIGTTTFPKYGSITALITGFGQTTGESATMELRGSFKWSAGGTLTTAANSLKFITSDATGLDLNITPSASLLLLTVTGSQTEEYKWHTTITTQII